MNEIAVETNTVFENEFDELITEETYKKDSVSWFDKEGMEKYRGRLKWKNIHKATIYGISSSIFLLLAALNIWQGFSFLLFLGLFTVMILTILIDSKTRFKWKK